MYPLKRDSPSLSVTPPINLVLINPKKNTGMNEENRRLIARVAPVCLAYNFHLLLVDFGIKETPLDFAKNIAPSTSIGKGGENLIKLCENGKVKITNLQLPQNIGEQIICTSQPEESKEKELNEVKKLANEQSIALVFGIDQRTNKTLRKMKKEAYGHLDITTKKIRLTLDSEIGAVCHTLSITKKA